MLSNTKSRFAGKNISLLFIAFLLLQITILAQEGWFWQNPLPQGNNLNDVWIIDENTIVAVGGDGLLLKTTNGGVDWNTKYYERELSGIQFTDNQTGWSLSEGDLLKTTNQAEHWEISFSDSQYSLTSFYFLNSDTGWIGSKEWVNQSEGVLMRTTNGGEQWEILADLNYSAGDVFFIDGYYGWILAFRPMDRTPDLLKTTDGGDNWIQIDLNSYWWPNSIYFADRDNGWIAWGPTNNLGGFVSKTTDGGNSWFHSTHQNTDGGFRSVYFLNADTGWVVGGNQVVSEILHTTNGGNVWTTESWESAIGLNSINFLNDNIGCIVGDAGVIFLTEDGSDWVELASAVTRNGFSSVDFINSNVGWAAGHNSQAFVYHPNVISTVVGTTNGGDSWETVFIDTNVALNSIDFINNSVGWVVGGKILKTTDGGANWQTQINGTYLNDVFIVDENIGFAVGTGMIKTTDGGSNWFNLPNPNRTGMECVFFIDQNVGWIVGSQGYNHHYLYKTTNGGVNWTLQLNTVPWLKYIYFIDADTGWAVGGNHNTDGTIIKTTNGGNSWVTQLSDYSFTFSSVHFTDTNNGWVSGYERANKRGIILSTTNGGEDWIEQESENINRLNSIYFADNNIGWAVGNGGTILKTTTGGVIPVELTSFTASTSQGNVTLNWATATETNNSGFEIERKQDKSNWERISFVEGHGTTTEPKVYSYVDDIGGITANSFAYRLKQIDYDGTFEYCEEVFVDNLAPSNYTLQQNYPNPFNPVTTIKYSLPLKSQVEIFVYNTLGEKVKQLVNGENEAGSYSVEFDATNLPSGVYFYRLRAGNFIETKKMVLMK